MSDAGKLDVTGVLDPDVGGKDKSFDEDDFNFKLDDSLLESESTETLSESDELNLDLLLDEDLGLEDTPVTVQSSKESDSFDLNLEDKVEEAGADEGEDEEVDFVLDEIVTDQVEAAEKAGLEAETPAETGRVPGQGEAEFDLGLFLSEEEVFGEAGKTGARAEVEVEFQARTAGEEEIDFDLEEVVEAAPEPLVKAAEEAADAFHRAEAGTTAKDGSLEDLMLGTETIMDFGPPRVKETGAAAAPQPDRPAGPGMYVPRPLDLNMERLEALVERTIRDTIGRVLERLVPEIIEQVVSRELEKLRRELEEE
ncbi:MAG: hypothetical protein AB1641_25815 [Thermodesulfobacteriota bacterium]